MRAPPIGGLLVELFSTLIFVSVLQTCPSDPYLLMNTALEAMAKRYFSIFSLSQVASFGCCFLVEIICCLNVFFAATADQKILVKLLLNMIYLARPPPNGNDFTVLVTIASNGINAVVKHSLWNTIPSSLNSPYNVQPSATSSINSSRQRFDGNTGSNQTNTGQTPVCQCGDDAKLLTVRKEGPNTGD